MTEVVSMWPADWPHKKPEQPLSIAEAHQSMQHHRACLRVECARKQAAWITLVATGRITPDAGRTQ